MQLRIAIPGIALLGLLGSVQTAQANITFTFPKTGNVNGTNILFNAPGLTTSGSNFVEGKTGSTTIKIASLTSELLEIQGSGQARVDGSGDGQINSGFQFTSVDITKGFTSVAFDVNSIAVGNGQNAVYPTFTVSAKDQFGNVFTTNTLTGQNGEPTFYALASNGELITSLTFNLNSGSLDDIKQIRVGVSSLTSVPEASTFLSFGGLVGAAGLLFRKRRCK